MSCRIINNLALLSEKYKAISTGIAIWLAAGYILPNTFISKWSGAKFIDNIDSHNSLLISNIIISILCITIWILYKAINPQKSAKYLLAWLALYIIIYSCSGLMSAMDKASVNWLKSNDIASSCYLLLTNIATGLIVSYLLGSINKAMKVIVILGTCQAIYVIIYRFTQHDHFISGDIIRASGTYNTPALLYPILMISIIQGIILSLGNQKRREKAVWSLCVFILTIALTLTWYRSCLIATLIAGLFIIVRVKARYLPITFILTFLLVSTFISFHVRATGSANFKSSENSNHSRLSLMKSGLQLFLDHPLMGVGIGQIRLPAKINWQGERITTYYVHPNNQLLFWLDEFGILGLTLYITLLVSIYMCTVTNKSYDAIGIQATWLSIFIAGCFNTVWGIEIYATASTNVLAGILLGSTLYSQLDNLHNRG